jgi:hypothetical protein
MWGLDVGKAFLFWIEDVKLFFPFITLAPNAAGRALWRYFSSLITIV